MNKIKYVEKWADDTEFVIYPNKLLEHKQTPFQTLDVYESKTYGKFFSLDNWIMVTEKDEFVYHEMITHVAMATNINIKKILLIGAGDGGVLRELCRYKTVEKIDMVEIDEEVITMSKKYFPKIAISFDDKRLNLYIEDGVAFIKNSKNIYDLIIIDSTDPFGPGEGLFTGDFYNDCYNHLSSDGILINQHESPYYEQYSIPMKRAHKRIKDLFEIAMVYQIHIPTYASGHWLLGFASKKYHPINDANLLAWEKLNLKTKYYNTQIHKGCFALPNYVKEMLAE